ncbi:baseplate J/gp47 family protein [Streptomyces sp. NPDC057743]|uniref:baseplate J/gp47 family protein n=1 Tax=Streptomyces sp. NPDC057743 TaxID=3346236 RepID=UPI00368BF11B
MTEKKEFTYTGSDQTWTVPKHVTKITARVWAAGGGKSSHRGGRGGYTGGIIPVKQGETLNLCVGGKGFDGSTDGGGGGGGYSYLAVGGTLHFVSGGGGGGSYVGTGGNGGGGGDGGGRGSGTGGAGGQGGIGGGRGGNGGKGGDSYVGGSRGSDPSGNWEGGGGGGGAGYAGGDNRRGSGNGGQGGYCGGGHGGGGTTFTIDDLAICGGGGGGGGYSGGGGGGGGKYDTRSGKRTKGGSGGGGSSFVRSGVQSVEEGPRPKLDTGEEAGAPGSHGHIVLTWTPNPPPEITQPTEGRQIGARAVFEGTGAKDKTIELRVGLSDVASEMRTAAKTTVRSDGTWTLTPTANLRDITDKKELHYQVRYDDNSGASKTRKHTTAPLKITTPTPNRQIGPREPITGTWYHSDHQWIRFSSRVKGGAWTFHNGEKGYVRARENWTYTPAVDWPPGTTEIKAHPWHKQYDAEERTVETTVVPPVITQPTEGRQIGARAVFEGTGAKDKTIELRVGLSDVASEMRTAAKTTVRSDGTWTLTPTANLRDITDKKELHYQVRYDDNSGASKTRKHTTAPLKITTPTPNRQIGPREPITGTWYHSDHQFVRFSSRVKGGAWTFHNGEKGYVRARENWTYTPAVDWPPGTTEIKAHPWHKQYDAEERTVETTVVPLDITRPTEGRQIGARARFWGTGAKDKTIELRVGLSDVASEMWTAAKTTVRGDGTWILRPTANLRDITDKKELHFQVRYDDNSGASKTRKHTTVPLKITTPTPNRQIGPREHITGTWYRPDDQGIYFSSRAKNGSWSFRGEVRAGENWTYTPAVDWPPGTTDIKAHPKFEGYDGDEHIVEVTVVPLVITQPTEGRQIGARAVFKGTGAKGKFVKLYAGTSDVASEMEPVNATGGRVDDKGNWTLTPDADQRITTATNLHFQVRYDDNSGASKTRKHTTAPLKITTPTPNRQIGPREPITGTWYHSDHQWIRFSSRVKGGAWTFHNGEKGYVSARENWTYTPAVDWPPGTTEIKAHPWHKEYDAEERTVEATVVPPAVTQPKADWRIGARAVFWGTGAKDKTIELRVGLSDVASEMKTVATTTVGSTGTWSWSPKENLHGITDTTDLHFQVRYDDNTGTSKTFKHTTVPLKITTPTSGKPIARREHITGTWHTYPMREVEFRYRCGKDQPWKDPGRWVSCDAQGKWSYTPSTDWPPGTTEIKAEAFSFSYNRDEHIIPVTVVPLDITGSDGVCGGLPVILGTGTPDKKVTLWSSETGKDPYKHVITTEPEALVSEDGKWSLTPTHPLAATRTILYLQARYTDDTDKSSAVRRTVAPLTLNIDPEKGLAGRERLTGLWVDDRSARVSVRREGGSWLDARPEKTPKAARGTGAWTYTPSDDFFWLADGKDHQDVLLKLTSDDVTVDRDIVEKAVRIGRLAIRNPKEDATIPQRHTFSGVGPPLREVELKRRSGGAPVGRTVVDEEGRWQVTPTSPLSPTTKPVQFMVGSDELGWSAVPVAVKVSKFAISQPQKGTQVCPREVFRGMGHPSSTITLWLGDNRYGETSVDDEGVWVLKPERNLPPGESTFTVQEKPVHGASHSIPVACTVVPLEVDYPAQHATVSPWQVFTGRGPADHVVTLYAGPDGQVDSETPYAQARIDDQGRWRLEAASKRGLPIGPVTVLFMPIVNREKEPEKHEPGLELRYRVRFVGSYSDGRPGQVVPLGSIRPGPGETLLAVTGSAQKERGYWAPVDTFAQAGERDQVFRVDPAAGLMTFGPELPDRDGPRQHGAVPHRGDPFTTVPAETAGAAGNLQAGSLTHLREPLEGATVRVHQAQPAVGGRDAETPAQALARHAGGFALGRAVTAADYRRLLDRAGIGVGRVVCTEPGDEGRSDRDLRITLIPDLCGPEPTKDNVTPTPSMLHAAWVWLEAIRPLGTVLTVGGPAVRRLKVTAEVELWSQGEVKAAEKEAHGKLVAYLHPLTGGPQGDGWPLGTLPQPGELYPLLEMVPAIRAVHHLDLEVAHPAGESSASNILPLPDPVTLNPSETPLYRPGDT